MSPGVAVARTACPSVGATTPTNRDRQATRGRFGERTSRTALIEAREGHRYQRRARVRRADASTTKVDREMRTQTVESRWRSARLPTTNKPLGDRSLTELESK